MLVIWLEFQVNGVLKFQTSPGAKLNVPELSGIENETTSEMEPPVEEEESKVIVPEIPCGLPSLETQS